MRGSVEGFHREAGAGLIIPEGLGRKEWRARALSTAIKRSPSRLDSPCPATRANASNPIQDLIQSPSRAGQPRLFRPSCSKPVSLQSLKVSLSAHIHLRHTHTSSLVPRHLSITQQQQHQQHQRQRHHRQQRRLALAIAARVAASAHPSTFAFALAPRRPIYASVASQRRSHQSIASRAAHESRSPSKPQRQPPC